MKLIVDSLPYYGELCPLGGPLGEPRYCFSEDCPRHWSKEKVCSPGNPHECEWLKEKEA